MRNRPSTNLKSAGALNLDFPASRTMSRRCLLITAAQMAKDNKQSYNEQPSTKPLGAVTLQCQHQLASCPPGPSLETGRVLLVLHIPAFSASPHLCMLLYPTSPSRKPAMSLPIEAKSHNFPAVLSEFISL